MLDSKKVYQYHKQNEWLGKSNPTYTGVSVFSRLVITCGEKTKEKKTKVEDSGGEDGRELHNSSHDPKSKIWTFETKKADKLTSQEINTLAGKTGTLF